MQQSSNFDVVLARVGGMPCAGIGAAALSVADAGFDRRADAGAGDRASVASRACPIARGIAPFVRHLATGSSGIASKDDDRASDVRWISTESSHPCANAVVGRAMSCNCGRNSVIAGRMFAIGQQNPHVAREKSVIARRAIAGSARDSVIFSADPRRSLRGMRAWHALPAQMRGMRFIVARVGAGPTRRVVARPQTGHDTAQACPSKHPDGFREALI